MESIFDVELITTPDVFLYCASALHKTVYVVDFSFQTLTTSDKKSLEMIPNVPGLLAYRADKKRLYVNEGSKWKALSNEQEVGLLIFSAHKCLL